MAVKSSDQITIVDLTDGYSIMLSLDAVSLNGDISTLGTAQSVTVNVTAHKGGTKVVPTIGAPTCPANVTASVGSASDSVVPVTINFAAALNAAGRVTIPVSVDEITINKEFAFGISFKGATGAIGPGAYIYNINASPNAVVKAENGTLTPTKVTFSATRAQGTGTPAAWSSGYWKIEYTADGSTWTTETQPTAASASYQYTVPATARLVRASLCTNSGKTTVVDTQSVPVISDGATGATGATGAPGSGGADAYTVVLTNESHSFAAGVSAAVAGTATAKLIAYKGGTQVSCYAGASASATSISTGISGLTCAISNNNSQNVTLTFTATTSLTTKSGTVNIPVVVDGKSFTKVFTFSLSLTGATGKTGATGDTGSVGATGDAGEDAINMVITTSNGNIFKNSSGNTILTAHVYKAGAEVTGNALTALGTIKWYKDGTYLSGKDGVNLTVNASEVSNKSTYTAQLE